MPDHKTVTFDATLLPCPFCGCENILIVPDEYGSGGQPVPPYHIVCRVCKTEQSDDEVESAIAKWNARAPTPAAQSAGQEAVQFTDAEILGIWALHDLTGAPDNATILGFARDILAAPVNGGERELGQVIDERDQYHDAAEKLADAIAKHFGVEIGEHSNLNCPWQNALDHIAQATKRAADAQQVGTSSFEFNHIGHEYTVYGDAAAIKALLQYRKHLEDVTANALKRAALTSPAKVNVGLHPAIREGVEAAFEGRDGWQTKIAAAARHLPTEDAKVGGDEREAFEAKFPIPEHCERCGNGYVATSYNAWDAHKHVTRWEGWKARAALSADGDMQLFFDRQQAGFERCYEALGITDDRERSWSALVLAITDALSADGGEDKRDAERLDFMIEQQAWVQWTVRDGSIRQCQVYTQDEDENYHILSGEDRFFNLPREAIDAAIAAKAKGDA